MTVVRGEGHAVPHSERALRSEESNFAWRNLMNTSLAEPNLHSVASEILHIGLFFPFYNTFGAFAFIRMGQ